MTPFAKGLLGIVDSATNKAPGRGSTLNPEKAMAGQTWVDDDDSDVCSACKKIILPGKDLYKFLLISLSFLTCLNHQGCLPQINTIAADAA